MHCGQEDQRKERQTCGSEVSSRRNCDGSDKHREEGVMEALLPTRSIGEVGQLLLGIDHFDCEGSITRI